MSPLATSKRHVVYVVVMSQGKWGMCECVLITKTDKQHFVFVFACVCALCIIIIMCSSTCVCTCSCACVCVCVCVCKVAESALVGGRQAHCSHGYDQSAVSKMAFYMDLEPHYFQQFRMVSLGRVLWDLACN